MKGVTFPELIERKKFNHSFLITFLASINRLWLFCPSWNDWLSHTFQRRLKSYTWVLIKGDCVFLLSQTRAEESPTQCLFDKKKRNIELETSFSVFFLDEIQSRHQEQLKQPLLLRGITGSLGSVAPAFVLHHKTNNGMVSQLIDDYTSCIPVDRPMRPLFDLPNPFEDNYLKLEEKDKKKVLLARR